METARFSDLLGDLGRSLDAFVERTDQDAFDSRAGWLALASASMPDVGVGIDQVSGELRQIVVPGGSRIADPGFWGFITTGPTSAPVMAATASMVAGVQRASLTAFNALEETALDWLRDLCELPAHMHGVFSSGGSVANLVALGAARQWTFEQRGYDVAASGVERPCVVYASDQVHHTVQRACAVLGLGRDAVRIIRTDERQRIDVDELARVILDDTARDMLQVAIVGNAGTTNTGAIDPLHQLATLADEHGIWFHVDGAYGLPGRLDPRVSSHYAGVERADSVIVDPHKWLAAPVGVASTFVRDRALLQRAFTQEPAEYLESALVEAAEAQVSMDAMGVSYSDMGVELSAPPRGAWVWALLREQGREGIRQRIITDNTYARHVADFARSHPRLQSLTDPELSIACIRYTGQDGSSGDLDALNTSLLHTMRRTTPYSPSATVVEGCVVIRPCFINPRTRPADVDGFLAAMVEIGDELSAVDHFVG